MGEILLTWLKFNLRLGSLKLTQIQNLNYSGWSGGWVAGLSGNIDHLNPIEVEVEVGLGLSLATSCC